MTANLPIAVHAFITNKNRILLLKRSNTGFNDEKWSVPAGRLEVNESISQAVVREAKEEVGLEIDISTLQPPLIMNHKDDRGERIYVFFNIKHWIGKETNMEPEKCSEIKWFNENELPANLVPHIKKALDGIKHSTSYLEYGFN